jgi:hypothetical protein
MMIERDLGSFVLDIGFKAAISRRIESRLCKLPGAARPTLAPLIENLTWRALQRSVRQVDGRNSGQTANAPDFAPLLRAGDNARDLASATRAVLKGIAKDLAQCASIDQRGPVVAAFEAVLDDLRNAHLDESRRAYGAAS